MPQGAIAQRRARVFQVPIVVRIAPMDDLRLPMAAGQENLLIVTARIALRLDIQESELTRVRAFGDIVHGHRMRVIPARARGFRREVDAQVAVRRHKRAAFFLGAIRLGRNKHAVPMHQLRRVRIVEDVDGYRFSFLHAQQRAGNLAVVADGLDDLARRDFKRYGSDVDGVIRLRGRLQPGRNDEAGAGPSRNGACSD